MLPLNGRASQASAALRQLYRRDTRALLCPQPFLPRSSTECAPFALLIGNLLTASRQHDDDSRSRDDGGVSGIGNEHIDYGVFTYADGFITPRKASLLFAIDTRFDAFQARSASSRCHAYWLLMTHACLRHEVRR